MAGRILPIALATVAGVSIGMTTFGREFEEQRRKKLEEKYKQEIAAISSSSPNSVSSLSSPSPPPITSSAIPAPSPAQLAAQKTESEASANQSSWSSILGLWAWRNDKKNGMEVPTREANGKP